MQPFTDRLAALNDQEAIQLLRSLARSDIDYPQYVQAFLDNPAPQRFDSGTTALSLATVIYNFNN